MAAVAELVLGVAALQEKPRFFVAFLVHVMQQGRIGVARQLAGQFIQVIEDGHEAGLGIGGGHGPHGVIQFHQRGEQFFFEW